MGKTYKDRDKYDAKQIQKGCQHFFGRDDDDRYICAKCGHELKSESNNRNRRKKPRK